MGESPNAAASIPPTRVTKRDSVHSSIFFKSAAPFSAPSCYHLSILSFTITTVSQQFHLPVSTSISLAPATSFTTNYHHQLQPRDNLSPPQISVVPTCAHPWPDSSITSPFIYLQPHPFFTSLQYHLHLHHLPSSAQPPSSLSHLRSHRPLPSSHLTTTFISIPTIAATHLHRPPLFRLTTTTQLPLSTSLPLNTTRHLRTPPTNSPIAAPPPPNQIRTTASTSDTPLYSYTTVLLPSTPIPPSTFSFTTQPPHASSTLPFPLNLPCALVISSQVANRSRQLKLEI